VTSGPDGHGAGLTLQTAPTFKPDGHEKEVDTLVTHLWINISWLPPFGHVWGFVQMSKTGSGSHGIDSLLSHCSTPVLVTLEKPSSQLVDAVGAPPVHPPKVSGDEVAGHVGVAKHAVFGKLRP